MRTLGQADCPFREGRLLASTQEHIPHFGIPAFELGKLRRLGNL
jgi:hypothetical protein